jgi:hypothetical protein
MAATAGRSDVLYNAASHVVRIGGVVVGWRETLATLKSQFEAHAARSLGLHHMMVEVADDERDKMRGPDWFAREADLFGTNTASIPRTGPWQVAQFSGLPWLGPHFRKVQPEESLEGIPPERIVRDQSGTPRAVFVPMRLRSSYLCGDTNSSTGFLALAEATSRSLAGIDFDGCPFADETSEIFRKPRGGIRQVFGDITDPPRQFIAQGWDSGILLYHSGVLIETPLAEQHPDSAHWLLLLHQLAWRQVSGSPLQAQRLSWHENMTVPYEWVINREANVSVPTMIRETLAQMSTTSYYSVLGTREHPLDVNLASAFAIDLLLSTVPTAEKRESKKANSPTRIRIVEPIGSGLDGRVYRAVQVDLDRPVAVKIIKRDAPNAADAIEHAKAIARVGNHPSIVTVYCVEEVFIEEHGTETAIVMELLDGEHFGNRLNGPRFTAAEVRSICDGVLDGMEQMHKSGVRHGESMSL